MWKGNLRKCKAQYFSNKFSFSLKMNSLTQLKAIKELDKPLIEWSLRKFFGRIEISFLP